MGAVLVALELVEELHPLRGAGVERDDEPVEDLRAHVADPAPVVGRDAQGPVPHLDADLGELLEVPPVRGPLKEGGREEDQEAGEHDQARHADRSRGDPLARPGEAKAPGKPDGGEPAVPLDGGVARYPQPGDRVNVYATFKSGQPVTRRILSGVEVLTTEAKGSGSPGAPVLGGGTSGAPAGNVVYLLAVTPNEAGQLVFGKQLGSVWLTLLPEGQQSGPAAVVTGGPVR